MDALFIYNPVAGQTSIERELDLCLTQLVPVGWHVDLALTTGPRHATELARKAAASGCDLVVAVGGDGTASEVANGLVETSTVMGVIPAGTTNVWALQVGIPSVPPWHPRKVVDRVLADLEEWGWHRPPGVPSWLANAFSGLLTSEVRPVDVGVVNGRHFLLWLGVGFDAVVTEHVEPEDKRRYGVLAYVASVFSVTLEYTGARMHLELEDRVVQDEVLMVLAANARLYGGVLEMAPRAYLDDGLLDVCVFKGDGIGTTVRHLAAVLAGRHCDEANVEYHQVSRLKVASMPSQPVHADDEICAVTPVDVSVRPLGLRILVPGGGGQALFSRPAVGRLLDLV